MLNAKIADHHLARQACIYIRQSTMAQVRLNQESTERQYNLANQAKSLGWTPEQIRILDGDLAQSGQQTTRRDDFKTLVSDVAMGQVGAIFSLDHRVWRAPARIGIDCWNYAPLPRPWCSMATVATTRPISTTASSSA